VNASLGLLVRVHVRFCIGLPVCLRVHPLMCRVRLLGHCRFPFSKVVGNRYPPPMAMPSALARSSALPVESWKTAKLQFMPLPSTKFLRTDVPEPFGATKITSMSLGGITPVCSFVDDAKAVAEVECVSFFEGFFDFWPYSFLCCVSE